MPSVSLQETPMPTKSLQRAPVAAPKVLACSPHGAPMPEKIPDRRKLKITERLRLELLQQKPQASLQGAPMPDKIPNSQKLKIPDLLKWELLQQKPLASPLKTAPVSCGQGAFIIDKISEKRNLKNPELPRKELLEKDAIIPDTTPVGAPVHVGTQQGEAVPPMSPHAAPVFAGSPKGAAVSAHTKKPQASCALAQTLPGAPITSPKGAPMPSQRKRVCPWSTAASDNADLRQSPSQKLCVEIDDLIEKVQLILKLDSYNHQAPLIATSQLNQGTQSSLQPWKTALDNAGVDQSLPQKKQPMEIKVEVQQSEPGSLDQMDYLSVMMRKYQSEELITGAVFTLALCFHTEQKRFESELKNRLTLISCTIKV
ncbi:hypothetical protein DPX16_10166 [Anabarilius grahami]|uniref:Uncharacterized protein n=1 Tax=Anabarilius grahami TaxID=495550 RepID=A0A3N0XXP9_ANAGA|nr:hypothetical protein DPX16_10166 [Anabarilius grahami]